MLRQICRVIIALGCLAGLSGPAIASPFSCLPGSFFSTMTDANSASGGPFGEACVTLTDSTHAAIQVETLSPFIMFGSNALGVSVNSSGFDIVGGTGGITGSPNVTAYSAVALGLGSTEDGFGKYDLTITFSDGPNSGTSFLTFTVVNNAGPWANVSSVLAANDKGYDVGIQLGTCSAAAGCSGIGFAAEPFEGGIILTQPAPEPGMLSLLAIGLLAMGWPALQRRKA